MFNASSRHEAIFSSKLEKSPGFRLVAVKFRGLRSVAAVREPMYRTFVIAVRLLLSHPLAPRPALPLTMVVVDHGMTCAHRTRPLGSLVTVSHEGHSIQCRVNDRGPFVHGKSH
jgi:rare lipoprotein A